MKFNCLLFIAFLCFFHSCKTSQLTTSFSSVEIQDSAIYNRLVSMNFEKYIDTLSVGEFLADVGRPYEKYTWGTIRSSYLKFVYFVYSDKLWVEIEVDDFRFMESWNKEHSWSIEKFKLERIGKIRFKYRGECVKCVESIAV